jgi:UDP-glucose 4-epimerase
VDAYTNHVARAYAELVRIALGGQISSGRKDIDMNILITGSAGFVGSDLVPRLNALGHITIGVDLVEENHSRTFVKHNLAESLQVELPSFELCIHLASSVGGVVFNSVRSNIVEVNDAINANVVALCKHAGCSRMLFFSTINVFESNSSFLHEPITVLDQRSPYSISKVRGEGVVCKEFEHVTVLRPTNIFGKYQLRRHANVGESHVIPDLLMKISQSEELEVLGDGSQIRNFIHVGDVTRFVTRILELSGKNFFNVRSEITLSIQQLANALIEFRCKEMSIKYLPEFLKYELFQITNFEVDIPRRFGFDVEVGSIAQGLEI